MKIKIIDLLVKIANGEEVPKKIKFMNSIWEYCKDGSTQDYINDYDKCLMEFIPINKVGLNSEVEVIEKSNKIEKLEPVRGSDLTDLTSKDIVLKNNALIELCKTLNNMNNKINELIDDVNKIKED